MLDIILSLIGLLQYELTLFCVIWFLIGGLDDIIMDCIWAVRSVYRRFTIYRHHKPMTSDELISENSQYAMHKDKNFHAIFIPTWRESSVIADMLDGCKKAWLNSAISHHIYVGCYPNDKATTAQVMAAARSNPNISLVICSHDGPTTKGDCLNHLWMAMLRDELNLGLRAISIILHDAEDRPHADSLAIFDHLIRHHDIVQLPVIPIASPHSPFISGHYCDEFCESHGKAMVVREAIGAALPLAGVGCAIERNCLGNFAAKHNNLPFNGNSVTEDYELGINIGSVSKGTGRGAIMVRMRDAYGNLVGTRSYFPSQWDDAVRQKSRWTMGIALSGWDRLGWDRLGWDSPVWAKATHSPSMPSAGHKDADHNAYRGKEYFIKKYIFMLLLNIAENWMRLRDRRAIFSAFTICCAYLSLILLAILLLAQLAGIYQINAFSTIMNNLILIASLMLLWRFIMRSAFLYYHYGMAQACLALPRMIVSNIISIMAARRAVIHYAQYCFGNNMVWDKTEHHKMPPNMPVHENIYNSNAASTNWALKQHTSQDS